VLGAGGDLSSPGPESLRRSVAWTLVGNALYAASQWGILVAIARLGSPTDVGTFALGLAVTAPVMLFANLKLRSVQATDQRGEYTFSEYLTLRAGTTTLALAVIVGVAAATRASGEERWVIALVGLAKAVESGSDLVYGFAQQRQRMAAIARSLIVRGLASLVAVASAMALTGSVVTAATALAACWLLILLVNDVPILRDPERPAEKGLRMERVWRLLRTALPLGAAVTIGSLSVNLPRYVLEHHRGPGDLGVFAAITSLLVASALVVNAVGQSASPRLARHHASGDVSAFRTLLRKLVLAGTAVGFAVLVAIAAFGRPLLEVLYGPEYSAHIRTLLWATGAAAVQSAYVFYGTALGAMRRFGVNLPIGAAGFAVVCLASFAWVPRHGMDGAAWAMLCGSLVEGLLYFWVTRVNLARWSSSPFAKGRDLDAA
jgi:O-antigen/teichoic acid export membrane protein